MKLHAYINGRNRMIATLLQGLGLWGLLAVCCTSCIYDSDEQTYVLSDGVDLALQVSLLDIDNAAADVEYMHDLRVIITHTEGDVEVLEYNRLIDLTGRDKVYRYGYMDDERLRFKVTDTERKHIYLLANSEPVLEKMLRERRLAEHPDPEDGLYGSNHRVETDPRTVSSYLSGLREATFSNDELQRMVADGGIPMSAEYDIIVKPQHAEALDIIVYDAYIVRACNKITFTYTNKKPEYAVYIQGWELEQVADEAYLFPHVNGTAPEGYDDWATWYSRTLLSGGDPSVTDFSVPGSDGYFSYTGGRNPTYAADPEYEHNPPPVKPEPGDLVPEDVPGLKIKGLDLSSGNPGHVIDDAVYYFPESRYVRSGESGQHYTMTFTTKEYGNLMMEGSNYTDRVYNADLDDVTTLFRNTHVRIAAELQESNQISLGVSIINWSMRDPTTGTLEPE